MFKEALAKEKVKAFRTAVEIPSTEERIQDGPVNWKTTQCGSTTSSLKWGWQQGSLGITYRVLIDQGLNSNLPLRSSKMLMRLITAIAQFMGEKSVIAQLHIFVWDVLFYIFVYWIHVFNSIIMKINFEVMGRSFVKENLNYIVIFYFAFDIYFQF